MLNHFQAVCHICFLRMLKPHILHQMSTKEAELKGLLKADALALKNSCPGVQLQECVDCRWSALVNRCQQVSEHRSLQGPHMNKEMFHVYFEQPGRPWSSGATTLPVLQSSLTSPLLIMTHVIPHPDWLN